ncbi:hypothetical protein PSPO01_16101 [Paraphaeosphaeria sporulosa]
MRQMLSNLSQTRQRLSSLSRVLYRNSSMNPHTRVQPVYQSIVWITLRPYC